MRWSNVLVVIMCVVAVGLGMFIASLSSSGQGGDTGSFQLPSSSAVAPTASPVQAGGASPTAGLLAVTAAATSAATATPAATATATPPSTEAAAFVEYTVQSGDTLKQIAEDHGVTVAQIIAVNEIPDPDSLTVGSVLRIPRP